MLNGLCLYSNFPLKVRYNTNIHQFMCTFIQRWLKLTFKGSSRVITIRNNTRTPWNSHQEQTGVQYLSQKYFGKQTINWWRASLSPEPQPPKHSTMKYSTSPVPVPQYPPEVNFLFLILVKYLNHWLDICVLFFSTGWIVNHIDDP